MSETNLPTLNSVCIKHVKSDIRRRLLVILVCRDAETTVFTPFKSKNQKPTSTQPLNVRAITSSLVKDSETHPPVIACLKLDLNVEFKFSLVAEFPMICSRESVESALSYNLCMHSRGWTLGDRQRNILCAFSANPGCHGRRRDCRFEPQKVHDDLALQRCQ